MAWLGVLIVGHLLIVAFLTGAASVLFTTACRVCLPTHVRKPYGGAVEPLAPTASIRAKSVLADYLVTKTQPGSRRLSSADIDVLIR
jgi:hypothetical protein